MYLIKLTSSFPFNPSMFHVIIVSLPPGLSLIPIFNAMLLNAVVFDVVDVVAGVFEVVVGVAVKVTDNVVVDVTWIVEKAVS